MKKIDLREFNFYTEKTVCQKGKNIFGRITGVSVVHKERNIYMSLSIYIYIYIYITF